MGRTGYRDAVQKCGGANAWWLQVAAVVAGLSAFGLYATLRAFEGRVFFSGDRTLSFLFLRSSTSTPLLAVFPGTAHSGRSAQLSRYLLLTIARRTTARSFFDPPACAISERKGRAYGGETKFPFICKTYIAIACTWQQFLLAFLWHDAVKSFSSDDGFGIGLGSWSHSQRGRCSPCICFRGHSLRHLLGGRWIASPAQRSARRAIRFGGNLPHSMSTICCSPG